MTLPLELAGLDADLRVAVVWSVRNDASVYADLLTTTDTVVEDDPFEVEFVYPKKVETSRLFPIETLYYETGRTSSVYVPRVVVYLDEAENGSLDVDGDVILALDGFSGLAVTAIPDVEQQLRQLSSSQLQEYYRHTGGKLTPFVLSVGGFGQRTLVVDAKALSLYVGDSQIHREDLLCARNHILTSFGASTATVYVDESIVTTGASLCALAQGTCVTVDLDDITLAPDASPREDSPKGDAGAVSSLLDAGRSETGGGDAASGPLGADAEVVPRPDASRPPVVAPGARAQCRLRGELAALIVESPGAATTCENCICFFEQDSYVVAADDLPAWWPCGEDGLPYCQGTAPLTQFDLGCGEGALRR